MSNFQKRASLGPLLYLGLIFTLGLYFAFAAIQGDYGLFQRAQINAESNQLRLELAELDGRVEWVRNKAHRMSDEYLDLDLLDEQARALLGMIRSDELVIR
jgi:cell division protein FtsB